MLLVIAVCLFFITRHLRNISLVLLEIVKLLRFLTDGNIVTKIKGKDFNK